MHSYFFIVFILLIFIMLSRRRRRKRIAAVLLRRRKKGKKIMGEILNAFIGKDVIIYTINDSSSGVVQGTVESVDDSWVTVKGRENGESQVINLEYVIRVREHPKDKNGKLKTIFD